MILFPGAKFIYKMVGNGKWLPSTLEFLLHFGVLIKKKYKLHQSHMEVYDT